MRLYAITILFATIVAAGCGKYFSFSPSGQLALTDHSLVIDNTYELYVRQTYKSGAANDKFMATNAAGASRNKKELIEVEYLVISKEKKNVLYFSTIPDKWQKYYSSHYLGSDTINCYDLRVLYTGKLDERNGSQVVYLSKDSKLTDNWVIEYNADNSIVTLSGIIERQNGEFTNYLLVKEALSDPIRFVRSEHCNIVYVNPFNNKPDTAKLLGNRIYFKKNKNKYEIFFRFDREVEAGYTDIRFKDKRLLYSPSPLF